MTTDTIDRDLTADEINRAVNLSLDVHQLEAGDRVIFQVPGDFPPSSLVDIRNGIQQRLPGLDFVIISGSVQVSVLRAVDTSEHGIA